MTSDVNNLSLPQKRNRKATTKKKRSRNKKKKQNSIQLSSPNDITNDTGSSDEWVPDENGQRIQSQAKKSTQTLRPLDDGRKCPRSTEKRRGNSKVTLQDLAKEIRQIQKDIRAAGRSSTPAIQKRIDAWEKKAMKFCEPNYPKYGDSDIPKDAKAKAFEKATELAKALMEKDLVANMGSPHKKFCNMDQLDAKTQHARCYLLLYKDLNDQGTPFKYKIGSTSNASQRRANYENNKNIEIVYFRFFIDFDSLNENQDQILRELFKDKFVKDNTFTPKNIARKIDDTKDLKDSNGMNWAMQCLLHSIFNGEDASPLGGAEFIHASGKLLCNRVVESGLQCALADHQESGAPQNTKSAAHEFLHIDRNSHENSNALSDLIHECIWEGIREVFTEEEIENEISTEECPFKGSYPPGGSTSHQLPNPSLLAAIVTGNDDCFKKQEEYRYSEQPWFSDTFERPTDESNPYNPGEYADEECITAGRNMVGDLDDFQVTGGIRVADSKNKCMGAIKSSIQKEVENRNYWKTICDFGSLQVYTLKDAETNAKVFILSSVQCAT